MVAAPRPTIVVPDASKARPNAALAAMLPTQQGTAVEALLPAVCAGALGALTTKICVEDECVTIGSVRGIHDVSGLLPWLICAGQPVKLLLLLLLASLTLVRGDRAKRNA
jgi:hypothetical protein